MGDFPFQMGDFAGEPAIIYFFCQKNGPSKFSRKLKEVKGHMRKGAISSFNHETWLLKITKIWYSWRFWQDGGHTVWSFKIEYLEHVYLENWKSSITSPKTNMALEKGPF